MGEYLFRKTTDSLQLNQYILEKKPTDPIIEEQN